MIKLKGIEFEESKLFKMLCEGKRYIISYRSIYLIKYNGGRYTASRILYDDRSPVPLTKRGRFFLRNEDEVKKIIDSVCVNKPQWMH